MPFIRGAGSRFPGLSTNVPGIPTTIKIDWFFDRAAVKQALTDMEYKALTRASLLVRRTAQKSITKVGAARPRLKMQNDNAGVPMSVLLKMPGVSKAAQRGLQIRIREMKTRPASAPGTPPNTHVPYGHMLGFRRNLYNAYDASTLSAVIGPSAKGPDVGVPHLHEFGGSKTLREYIWQPRYPRYNRPIMRWVAPSSRLGSGWLPTGRTRRSTYPARPFMLPALTRSLPRIAQMFSGQFRAGRGAP